MFKPTGIAIVLAVTAFSVTPLQTPTPPTSLFSVPDGPLPWSLPQIPSSAVALSVPTVTLDDLEHSAAYATMESDVETQVGLVVTPMADMIDGLDSLVGTGGALPDMSSGELSDTGLDPNDTGSMTIADFQAAFVADITTALSYARVAQSISSNLSAVTPAFVAIFIAVAWMTLVRILLFSVQFSDFLSTVIPRFIDLLKKVVMSMVGFFGG
jgi:hypothetical protein